MNLSSQLIIKLFKLSFIILLKFDVLLIKLRIKYFILNDRFGFWKVSYVVHVLKSLWFDGLGLLFLIGLLFGFFLLFLMIRFLNEFIFSFFASGIIFFWFRTMIDKWVIIILFFDNRLYGLRLLFFRFFEFLSVIDIYWLSGPFGCIATSPFPRKGNVCIFRHI